MKLKLEKQREFYRSGKTLSIEFRIQMLKKLYSTIQNYEQDITEALKKDLGKSNYEAYICEIGTVLSEISFMLKHIKKLSKEKTVRTPVEHFPSRSYVKPSPYGNVLIMSPWNYPFMLTMEPLVDAIAAGNTAIVKPSAYSPHVSTVIHKMISECFDENYVSVVMGGRKEIEGLLDLRFDFIFFTGSTEVGKIILRHAAEHLTPVVLELGGKSPCIVDSTAKMKLAAKRIVFGKYINCGQTCVVPDYILCHSSIKDDLIKELKHQIELQYSSNPLNNPDYGKIINGRHFDRVNRLIDPEKVIHGGKTNRETLQIEPTLLLSDWNDLVMQEEIFGPVLPVLTYDSLHEVIETLKTKPRPLALYLFTQDKQIMKYVTEQVQYGGGCVNDVVIHPTTSEIPFGGVGESGMGSYHGKAGFEVFSHYKGIINKKTWLDLPMRYQPYRKELYDKIAHLFLR